MTKIKSIEDMARDDIRLYMTPVPQYGFSGFNQEIAVRKAAAANLTRAEIIRKIGATEKLNGF